MIRNRFAQTMNDMRGLIGDGSALLLAVSGGMDSMCMADLFLSIREQFPFAVAHCNFNLRGSESDGDEAMVKEWAEANNVRFHSVSFDTEEYAAEHGISIEMAARDLRYGWFASLCREHGYKATVVAHHADDNAETMVLNLVRGTGLKGMSGMNMVSSNPYSDGLLLRPMLAFTRKQIEGYVFSRKIPYREDRTNASVEYRRNSIRHEVFPLFERMNPSYVRTLNREMTYFKDASDIVDQWCSELVPKVCRGQSETFAECISISDLLVVPQWRYLLYRILEPYGFNTSVLESIESLLVSDRTISGKRFESDGYFLLTERDRLLVVRKTVSQADAFMPVRCAGAYHVNGSRVVVEVVPWTVDMPLKQPDGILIFDADKLKFPFICRKWRAGDWMIPLGMKGRKKISDLFTDLKYGHFQKDAALVVVDCQNDMAEKQHVAALLPVRIDNAYKVSSETRNIIRIKITE